MTRKETLKHFKTWCQNNIGNHCSDEDFQMANNIMALLEQEPCRDVEIKKIDEWEIQGKNAELWIVKGNLQVRYLGTIHNISLPLVTPQPKTGHWIRVTDKAGHLVWECDNCGWQQRFNTNFCPDCGCRMVEPQERNKEWVNFAEDLIPIIDTAESEK